MYRIIALNSIAPRGIAVLEDAGYTLLDSLEAGAADGIVLRSADLHGKTLPDGLRAIARAGAGVNNIPVDECTRKGIVVFNTPGANANSVKELVIAALLLSSRKIVEGVVWTRGLGAEGLEQAVEKGKKQFAGPEIATKRLGVIGLGSIGVMVANAAYALDMDVTGYDPYISVQSAWGLHHGVDRADSVDALLAASDYITLHVPLNSNTRGMINADSISRMKDGVRILNFARADLVDESALKSALDAGKVASYVTDFPTPALAGHPSVIPIPHLGASTPEAEENCAAMAAAEIRDFLAYGNIRNSVNFPDCSLPPGGQTRIVFANKNVPNMVGQVTGVLAAAGLNIHNMNNRGSGELAYNIIDLDAEPTKSVVQNLSEIPGIFMLRVIKTTGDRS